MPMRGELSIAAAALDGHALAADAAWSRFVATIRDPNLVVVTSLCAIGLLITLSLIHSFPNLAATDYF